MTKHPAQTEERAARTTAPSGRAGEPKDIATSRATLPVALAAALDAAIDKGGRAPAILHVAEIAGYTDYVLLVSARNDRQVAAISEAVTLAAKAAGARVCGTEGQGEHLWDLVDFDDFMVHVFFHPVRLHYDLESMWSDAPRVPLGLAAEIMDTTDLDDLALPAVLPSYRGDATFGGFDDEFGPAGAPSSGASWQPPARTRLGRRPAATDAEHAADSIVGGDAAADDEFEGDDFDDDFDDDFEGDDELEGDDFDDDFEGDDEPDADPASADDAPAADTDAPPSGGRRS
ncbi:MAG: ribosome silencing factor [Deltaproteobacteria bacterium]|nr:ribosome silencing factor [Deltaproteobacteria bacterium]MBK8238145.1 ribosome silencing factor [Deltaproteobacteria bacterium]MBP7288573.1 ribosome silencing factor [Nannocystaceae bacterium]